VLVITKYYYWLHHPQGLNNYICPNRQPRTTNLQPHRLDNIVSPWRIFLPPKKKELDACGVSIGLHRNNKLNRGVAVLLQLLLECPVSQWYRCGVWRAKADSLLPSELAFRQQ
jgi:hypothetical protein